MVMHWNLRKRPAWLERHVEFDGYERTREFLDQAAELSERENFYPDMSFGRTQVSMTINAAEGSDELAEQLNKLAEGNTISVSGATN